MFVDVLILTLALAPVPFPTTLTSGVISNLEDVFGVAANAVDNVIWFAEASQSLIKAYCPLAAPAVKYIPHVL